MCHLCSWLRLEDRSFLRTVCSRHFFCLRWFPLQEFCVTQRQKLVSPAWLGWVCRRQIQTLRRFQGVLFLHLAFTLVLFRFHWTPAGKNLKASMTLCFGSAPVLTKTCLSKFFFRYCPTLQLAAAFQLEAAVCELDGAIGFFEEQPGWPPAKKVTNCLLSAAREEFMASLSRTWVLSTRRDENLAMVQSRKFQKNYSSTACVLSRVSLQFLSASSGKSARCFES